MVGADPVPNLAAISSADPAERAIRIQRVGEEVKGA
jgi:hypothetical protein